MLVVSFSAELHIPGSVWGRYKGKSPHPLLPPLIPDPPDSGICPSLAEKEVEEEQRNKKCEEEEMKQSEGKAGVVMKLGISTKLKIEEGGQKRNVKEAEKRRRAEKVN